MSNLGKNIDKLRHKYREVFLKVSEEIKLQLDQTPPENLQKFLNEDIVKDIERKWIQMLAYRDNFGCVGCATCCKLACSEYSYEELKQKAQNGDNFATQFVSIFVPYENQDEPKEIYPEYFELLQEKLEGEKVYFYHCPRLSTQNRCCDYENRPAICRDFPDNPLSLLPAACGFAKWKTEVEPTALMLHSTLEIANFYREKLKE